MRPNSSTTAITRSRAVAFVAGAGLALSSCSAGSGQPNEAGSPASSASPSPTSTVAVARNVSLTDVGADLAFGDAATVIYEPNRKRGTVLELTVTRAARGSVADFKSFILDDYTKAATPYYVTVIVENVGEGRVGGTPVPLWGVDGENTLLPAASFTTNFSTCESEPLPKKFAAGDRIKTCLVYLAPDGGTLEAVSFRPNQQFDPIQWTGDIATPKPEPKNTKKTSAKKKRRR